MVRWGQEARGAASSSSMFVPCLMVLLLCTLGRALAAEVVFGLQLNDDAADSYGSSMSYDERTHRLYITGATYSGYFKTGYSQIDESAIKSDCFFGVLQLPQQVFMSPQWIRRVQIGMPDVTEACSSLYVSPTNGDVYLLGHSTHSTSVMAPLGAHDTTATTTMDDATINASRSHTTEMRTAASPPPPSAAGLVMHLTRGATLVGGALMEDDAVQYPIAVQGDPYSRFLFVASVKSSDGRTNPKFEQLRSRTHASHLDMSTAGYLPPEFGSNFTISVQCLIREANQMTPAGLERFNVNIQKTLRPSWSREFGVDMPRSLQVAALLYATPDYLIVSGSTHRSSGHVSANDALGDDWDGFLLFLHPATGQQLSSHRVRSSPIGDDRILGMCKSESNPTEFYVVGITESQIWYPGMREAQDTQQTAGSDGTSQFQKGAYRAFILKMNAENMETLWVSYVDAKYDTDQSMHPPQVHGMACAVTSDGGNVYMAGTVKEGAVMDVHGAATPDMVDATAYGGDDIFVAQYETSEGNLNFAKQLGTMYDDSLGQGDSLVTNANGDAIILGNTNGSLMRNKETPETTDVFVLSLARKRGHHLPFYETMMDLGNTKTRQGFSVSTNPYYFYDETDKTGAVSLLAPTIDDAATTMDGPGTGAVTRDPAETVPQHFAPAKVSNKTLAPTMHGTGVVAMVTRLPRGATTANPITSAVPSTVPSSTHSSAPPSNLPSSSQAPSQVPSQSPSSSAGPSILQSSSQAPSQVPSQSPSISAAPSILPSSSQAPSQAPSQPPSQFPSLSPSWGPSQAPSQTPSKAPSNAPTTLNATTAALNSTWTHSNSSNATNATAYSYENTANSSAPSSSPTMETPPTPKPLNATELFESMQDLITHPFLGGTKIPNMVMNATTSANPSTFNTSNPTMPSTPDTIDESQGEEEPLTLANRSSLPPRKDPEPPSQDMEIESIESIAPESLDEATEAPSYNGEFEATQHPMYDQETENPEQEGAYLPVEIHETQVPTKNFEMATSRPTQNLRAQAPGLSPTLKPSPEGGAGPESDQVPETQGRLVSMPLLISLIILANLVVAIGLVLIYFHRRRRWKRHAKITPEVDDSLYPAYTPHESKRFLRHDSDSEDTSLRGEDGSGSSEEEVVEIFDEESHQPSAAIEQPAIQERIEIIDAESHQPTAEIEQPTTHERVEIIDAESHHPSPTIEKSTANDAIDGQILFEMRPPQPKSLHEPPAPLNYHPTRCSSDDIGTASSLTPQTQNCEEASTLRYCPLPASLRTAAEPCDARSNISLRHRPIPEKLRPLHALGHGHDFSRAKLWDETPPECSLSRSFSSVVDVSEDSLSMDKYAKETQEDDDELDKYAKQSPA